MRILNGSDLSRLLSPTAIISAVEDGLHAYARGQISVPMRHHVDWSHGTLLVMPAVGPDVLGVKCVSVVPGNAIRHVPTASGVMVLIEATTGMPCAILDAALLTARRTGAIGAISLKLMTPTDVDSIGIIGTGVQAAWQAISACAVRPIKGIFYVARSSKSERCFIDTLARHVPHVSLRSCSNVADLLNRTSVVIAATTSTEPVLPDDPALLRGKHFISVGSFKSTMQELPTSVYRLAGRVIVDSHTVHEEAGDIINSLKGGVIGVSDVSHLADLLSGQCAIDIDDTTAFKSVGMALYDLCAAQALFKEALRTGVGSEVNWGDELRAEASA